MKALARALLLPMPGVAMFTYECTVKFGHMGAGNSFERNIRVRAHSIIEAMRRAKRMPGVKKGRNSLGGASVTRISMVP